MTNGDDLGFLLRRWRDRAAPPAVGLGDGDRRRAPGLRREELAELAGVSADYIKRLEQGRGRPSAGVLNSLARALRLSRAEYEYLCVLAGHAAIGTDQVPRHVGAGSRRLLDRLSDTPVAIFDATWTLLAWNASWESMKCDAITSHGRHRNIVWRTFTGDFELLSRTSERQARFEASIVADLRNTARRYPADEWLADLVADLLAASGTFAKLWQSESTARYQDDRGTLRHPDTGDVTLDCDILTIHDGDLRALVFSAEAASVDAARLAMVNAMKPEKETRIGIDDFPGAEPTRFGVRNARNRALSPDIETT